MQWSSHWHRSQVKPSTCFVGMCIRKCPQHYLRIEGFATINQWAATKLLQLVWIHRLLCGAYILTSCHWCGTLLLLKVYFLVQVTIQEGQVNVKLLDLNVLFYSYYQKNTKKCLRINKQSCLREIDSRFQHGSSSTVPSLAALNNSSCVSLCSIASLASDYGFVRW